MTHASLNFSIWMAEARGMWYHLLSQPCGPRGRYGKDFLLVKHNEFDPMRKMVLSLFPFHFIAK